MEMSAAMPQLVQQLAVLWGSTISVCAAEELAALCSDFPEYDGELLKGMLEDQAGDVPELRAVLRVSAFHSNTTAVSAARTRYEIEI